MTRIALGLIFPLRYYAYLTEHVNRSVAAAPIVPPTRATHRLAA